MPHLEFGHIYKFLASAGLALLFVSLTLPWVVMQSLAPLDITQERLSALTPAARTVIQERQASLLLAQEWLAPLCVLLALAGIVLLLLGLRGWWKRQRIADAGENVDVATKEAAFAKMSGDQVEEKLVLEASEDVTLSTAGPDSPSATSGEPVARYAVERQESVERLRRNEERLVRLLRSEYGQLYDVRPNVRLASGAGAGASIDVLLDAPPDSGWSQLAIDLRLVRMSSFAKNIAMRMESAMLGLAIASAGLRVNRVYTGKRGRPPAAAISAMLLLVAEGGDPTALDQMFSRVQRHAVAVNSVLSRPVAVIVVHGDRFDQLTTAEFRSLISDAWSSDEGATILVS